MLEWAEKGPGLSSECHMSSDHIYSHQTAGMTSIDLDDLCMHENLSVTS